MYSLVIKDILRPQPRSVSSQGQSKTKYFTLKQSRRGNKARTGSRSSTSLPSNNTQTTEAEAMMKDEEQSLIFRKSHGSIQQSYILREPSKSDTVISPDHSFPQPLLQDYQPTFFLPPITTLCTAPEIRSCPAKQDVGLTEKVLSPLFLEPQPTQLAVSLVRDEDISPMSNTKSTQQSSALDQGRAQAHIRFQYILAP